MHLLDGRAAATSVILAGVRVTLRSRRAVVADEPRAIDPVRKTLIHRGLFLHAVGFVNLLVWPGDTLRVYGVSLLVTAGLMTASDRRLLSVVLGFVAADHVHDAAVLDAIADGIPCSTCNEWSTSISRCSWTRSSQPIVTAYPKVSSR
jgi:hypothetical protein